MNEPSLPGLYIHVPFCKTKCPYCDFFSITDHSLVSAWVDGIEKELDIYRDSFPVFDSFFLGGGTPSLLSEQDLSRLMESITSLVTIAPESEITLEANPDDVNREKLKAIKSLGVNRISLGVQSFHDHELRYLQRRHTAQQSEAALEMIRSAGFSNLGIDLMYGLEGQKDADWIATLEKALSYSPEHLSCYQLTIEGNTPFGTTKNKKSLVDEEAATVLLPAHRFLILRRPWIHPL